MSGRMPGRMLDYMPGHVLDCRTGHRTGHRVVHVPGRWACRSDIPGRWIRAPSACWRQRKGLPEFLHVTKNSESLFCSLVRRIGCATHCIRPLDLSSYSMMLFLVYIVNLFIFVMPLRLKRIAVNGEKYVNQNVMGREGLQRQEALHHLPRDRHRRQGFQWICRCAQGLPLLARPAIVLSMNKISAYLRRHMNIPMCSYPVLEYARSGFRSQWRTCPPDKSLGESSWLWQPKNSVFSYVLIINTL